MFDQFNRKIDYLRVSVTDRCNLRCVYCMPEEGIQPLSHNDILSYDEIFEIVTIAVRNGVTKVRLTGGEPLVRKNILQLVQMIGKIEGIRDFSMTTNAVLLAQYAQQLKDAGLHRINISLDTINPERFKEITRWGNLKDVFEGIYAAQKAGLNPIKINCVIKNNPDEPDATAVTEFCKKNNIEIRYIREMDLNKGEFWQVKGGDGGNCSKCNRLRITSNGRIKPCLFSNLEYDMRKLGIENALTMALKTKPISGTINSNYLFNQMGG